MVPSIAKPEVRKRKPTQDMENSPPKRVTRARAKVIDNEAPTVNKTRIMTTSARVAAGMKAEGKSSRSAESATKREPSSKSKAQPNLTQSETVLEGGKPRGRPKKSETEATQELAVEKEKTVMTRKRRDEKEVEPPKVLPQSKGRPRKETAAAPKSAELVGADTEAAEAPRRITRTRKVTAPEEPLAATVGFTRSRKKVTFEVRGLEDKENVPVQPEEPKGSLSRRAGLKAMPVRKVAPTRSSARGRKTAATKSDVSSDTASTSTSQPLSPKKITQVARSDGTSSEDELCDKTPVKPLSKSPVRPPWSVPRIETREQSSQVAGMATNIPSPKFSMASIIASPPRRPPVSPFKDSLKECPRRINIGSSPIKMDSSLPQNNLKASLLRSPARRPASPTKKVSPIKIDRVNTRVEPEATHSVEPHKLPTITPQRLFKTQIFNLPSEGLPRSPSLGSHTPIEAGPQSTEDLPTSVEQIDDELDLIVTVENNPTASVLIADVAMQDALPDPEINLGTTPPGVPPIATEMAFSFTSPAFRYNGDFSDSEDELLSDANETSIPSHHNRSIMKTSNVMTRSMPRDNSPSTPFSGEMQYGAGQASLGLTPLAFQLSAWLAPSPTVGGAVEETQTVSGMCSSRKPRAEEHQQMIGSTLPSISPLKSTLFDDEMVIREQELVQVLEDVTSDKSDALLVQTREDSHEPEEYGDENALPIDPQLLSIVAEGPEILVTPIKAIRIRPREIHTVSKVPLRPAAEDSPIKLPKKRARSLTRLSEVAESSLTFVEQHVDFVSLHSQEYVKLQKQPPSENIARKEAAEISTPIRVSSFNMITPTPCRSVRQGLDAQILRGAVVFVDVHTTEGADASGIFVELLTSMGARCIKQWNWNSRSSSGGSNREVMPTDEAAPSKTATPNGKVGITHVVFKDGSKRTMQKVRDARGLVLCVGVSWVLDCERENQWLDEAEHAVDTSTIPRGGHNRRKSMEPRMLANVDGSLVPSKTSSRVPSDASGSRDELSSDSFQSSIVLSIHQDVPMLLGEPSTPTPVGGDFFAQGIEDWGSPTTPYYLSKGAKLVQQTCPPKKMAKALFPVSGRIEDQPDESVRQRLILARRKSLQWAPKVGSPLGRAVSYGK